MHIDKDGNKWLGTRSGLVFWNTKTDEKRLFNRNDGLSSKVIYAVYEDKHNRLWLSSNYGIMSFDKESYHVNAYLLKDGIAQEEFKPNFTFPGRRWYHLFWWFKWSYGLSTGCFFTRERRLC